MTRLLVVAALKQELAPLRQGIQHPSIQILQTGVGPALARQAIRDAPLADLIISTGCCGGLSAELNPGDLIIASRVCALKGDRVEEAPCPASHLMDQMSAAATGCSTAFRLGGLLTSAEPLRTPQQKQTAAEISGAAGVDMETSAIAEVAAARGIPYISIRVVLDTVFEALPGPPAPTGGGRSIRSRGREALADPLATIQIALLRRRLVQLAPRLTPCIKAFCLEAMNHR